ncbi:MAG: hypothetical protein JW993_14020 [Sedimentisphaerales bacterium]|nr:hypothetical protein [Sedimentisphaerales bacterium]
MSGIALFPIVLVFGAVFTVLMLLLAGKGRGRAMGIVAGVMGLVILGVFFLRFFGVPSPVSTRAVVSQSSSGVVHQQVTPFLSPLVFVLGFIFIVLVALLAGKGSGKAVVGVLIGVVLLLAGFFVFAPIATHRRYVERVERYPAATAAAESDQRTGPPAVSPIWSEGLEQEFDADIYPSRLAATQAVGRRINKLVRELMGDSSVPSQITLFHEASDPALIAGLRDAIRQTMSQTTCTTESYLRNLGPNEIGITMQLSGMTPQLAPWASGSETRFADGVVHVHVFTTDAHIIPQSQFIEMPWVENFAAFANVRPERRFLIARSREACTNEGQARMEAMEDARLQLSALVEPVQSVPGGSVKRVSTRDIEEGHLVADTFVQSFDGSAGRIWRQALLIDASPQKIAWLNSRLGQEIQLERVTWARMIASALGVLVVILVTYFFLNMATRGYYVWSLRIAGLVLAIVAVVFIFLLS